MYGLLLLICLATLWCGTMHALSFSSGRPGMVSTAGLKISSRNNLKVGALEERYIKNDAGSIKPNDEPHESGNEHHDESSPLLRTDPRLTTGKLNNGMQYKILNRYDSVKNKDEVGLYLEILAGSADENDRQRGMAHALEHILQENNPKRYLLADSSNSIHSNAFTDLHHTVYTIDNINMKRDSFYNHQILSNSMKTLAEVFSNKQINEEVLKNEVDIIKSEASMIHSNEYKKQSTMLGILHRENILSMRLPIGLVHTASKWTVEDLKRLHEKYYKPSNAILYIVGDLSSPEKQREVVSGIEKSISRVFESRGEKDHLQYHANKERTLKSVISNQFPPVKRHIWSVGNQYLKDVLGYPNDLIGKPAGYNTNRYLGEKIVAQAHAKSKSANADVGGSTNTTDKGLKKMEPNEALIQLALPTPIMLHVGIASDNSSSTNYECHIYAKKPIVSIKTEEDLKLFYYQRLILWLIRSRLMHHEHTIDSCKHLAFDEHEFPREGCAVNAISVVTRDIEGFYSGLKAVLQELMRIGSVTDPSAGFTTWKDVVRYARMVISETEEIQRHRQATSSNMDVAEWMMDQSASGHTLMSPDYTIDMCKKLLHFVEEDTAAHTAKEMCHHVCDMNVTDCIAPHSIVLCAPKHSHQSDASDEISPEKVKTFITNILKEHTPFPGNFTTAGIHGNPLPNLPSYPTPRKLFHRKNTIIRLWRMIAPQYVNPPRRKIIPVMRGGATPQYSQPDTTPSTVEQGFSNGFAYNQVVTAAPSSVKKSTRSHDPSTMTERQLRILEYKKLVQPNYEQNVEIEQNQLASNGLYVNYVASGVEPNRVMAQLKIPGGRLAGSNSSALLMDLGARMLQEGSSIGRRSLDTIQFFCLERKIQMDISLESDCLLISFSAPAKTIGVERYHRNNGLEMILHLLRGILKDYQYDKNSYNRVMKTIEREFSPTAVEVGRNRSKTGAGDNVIRLSHSSQPLDALCRAAIRGRVAHSDARFVPLSCLTTFSNTSAPNRYGIHKVDKGSNPLANIKRLLQSQLSKLQHQEYALALPGAIAASANGNSSAGAMLTDKPTRDKVCAGVELTVAGNMTLGRMRELTVKILGTVLSDKQMHYVENTVRPSRKMKRKLQQQKLKDEFDRRALETFNETSNGSNAQTPLTVSSKTEPVDTISDTDTKAKPPSKTKPNNRRKSGAAQKNRAMRSSSEVRKYDASSDTVSDTHRFDGVRGVAWDDASNILIEAVADGCYIEGENGGEKINSSPSVKHAVGYLVGPAYNKHGVLCDRPLSASRSKSNDIVHTRISPPVEKVPYLAPTASSSADTENVEELNFYSKVKPNRLSNSVVHTGPSVESLKNREKLEKYLRRLKIVQEQEEYDDNPMNYYKSHPLYVQMMTMLIEQILTNKLYASIRDEHNLAYDVSFKICSLDSSINLPNDAVSLSTSSVGGVSNTTTSLSLPGGWYEVEVMTSADKMNQALAACKHIIEGIGNEAAAVGSNQNRVQAPSAESDRMNRIHDLLSKDVYQQGVVTAKHIEEKDIEEAMRYIELAVKKEKYSLKYWIEALSGSQLAGLQTSLVSVDKLKILKSITLKDIQHTLCKMKFAKSKQEFSCVAVAV